MILMQQLRSIRNIERILFLYFMHVFTVQRILSIWWFERKMKIY